MSMRELRRQVREAGVISGFHYPFAKILVERLQEMMRMDTMLAEGESWPEPGRSANITMEAQIALGHLADQVQGMQCVHHNIPTITAYLEGCQKFLLNFEPRAEHV